MNELGLNIRMERKRQRISLQQLADQVEVTPSFLSQIENGKNEPSLTTLKKIASSLGVTVSKLIGEDESARSKLIKKNGRHKLINLWRGLNIEFLSAIESQNVMEACIHEVALGAEQNSACTIPYTHEGQEFFFVLEGDIVLSVDGELMAMEPGDSYYLCDCSKEHFFFNARPETGTAKVMCVTTPPYFYSYNK